MTDEIITIAERRRRAALRAMDKLADEHGARDRDWEEIDMGDINTLVGIAADGSRFAMSYQKETEQERFDRA